VISVLAFVACGLIAMCIAVPVVLLFKPHERDLAQLLRDAREQVDKGGPFLVSRKEEAMLRQSEFAEYDASRRLRVLGMLVKVGS
jgi:hypothetical protein